MTPEEIQEVINLSTEAWKGVSASAPDESKDFLYVIGTLIPTLILLGRWFKKVFVKAMSEAVEKIVDNIMNVHTEKVDKLEKRVDVHETMLDRIKHKCIPNEVNKEF